MPKGRIIIMKKLLLAAGCAAVMAFTACNKIPKNTVHSIADLNGKVIGVQLGTVAEDFVSDISDNVERYNKGADAVRALKLGNVDAVVIDAEPARVYVENNSDLAILDETFPDEEYAIAFKKGNTALKENINSVLAELKADGTLDRIKNNWIGEEAGKDPYVSPENADRSKGTLTMATNAEFPPYELMENDDIVGFDVDMMRSVCDRLGYELKIENIEFESIFIAVEEGTVDVGAAGITVNPERLELVDFSDPYTTSRQVVVVRK